VLISRRAAAADRPDEGVGLVEVMIAMVLFVIGSLSLLTVFATSMSGTFDNRARLTAANLAAADIDQARSLDYYALTGADYIRTVDGRDYRIVREVAATMSSGADPSSCIGSGSAKQLYKRVSTRVETSFRGPARPVRSDTLVKAPAFDPTTAVGALSVMVIDRSGAPLPGLPVHAAGVDRTTDAQGCAFFDALQPGVHTATVQRPGSVTVTGDAVLTTSATVAAGQIASEVLRIDEAVPITVTGDVFTGTTAVAGYALSTGLTARLAAPDRATSTKFVSAAQPVTAGTALTWNSFPDPGGYDAYLGPCSPAVHTAAEPGTSPMVVLPLSPVDVKVAWQDGTGPSLGSKEVTVDWLSPECSEPLRYTARTTCATDCSVRLAVPPGTWRLRVVGLSGLTDVTVDPRTALTTTVLVA
jgi:Tfp pilus assembly protein PilV